MAFNNEFSIPSRLPYSFLLIVTDRMHTCAVFEVFSFEHLVCSDSKFLLPPPLVELLRKYPVENMLSLKVELSKML